MSAASNRETYTMTLASRTRPATAIASLVFAALLGTQSPPPTGAVSTVGMANQLQLGGPAGDQRIGGICAPAFYRGSAPLGSGGVALGGSICWWSEAIHPNTSPLTLHAAGSCITLFLVAPFQFTSLPLPFAAPAHDRLFLPPQGTLVTPAPWTQVLTTGGGGAIVPPGGYDRWFLTVDVPNQPSLLGSVWASQSTRLDPSNLLFYFSDEWLVQVWN